ncbi:MAG: OmpA family protein [Bacteroidales bacterium]|jgi:outer membrane protein OmpA-like peptidoglycan-associated protein|nr:OmpA family protein [Bacteroidales bacterium]
MNKLILLLLLLTIPFLVSAQHGYTTKNKKAINYYEEALSAFGRMDYFNAADLMHKAIKADKKFIEAHIVLAEIYMDHGNAVKAIESYQNALAIDPDFFPGVYFSLAQLEMMEQKFEQAEEHLEKYLAYKDIQPISRSQAERTLESCRFAIEATNNPVPFNPEDLGNNINTQYDEYWPTLTADEQTLIFTRLIPKNLVDYSTNDQETEDQRTANEQALPPGMRNVQEDFYISFKADGQWTEAVNAGKTINTAGNEGAQTITADGRTMYFTACNRTDGKGRCDIYKSVKTGSEWSVPENIGSPVNTAHWEAQPSISPDGKTLYFVSNRPGGIGQKDIWKSNLLPDGRWTPPQNLGKNVNTPGEEQSPFIHPDNQTLYFSSEGLIGMGGFDLFKVTRQEDGTWTEPQNLGYPINSSYHEVGLIVNAAGNKAFFASDRLSNRGRDLFAFDLYQEMRPKPVSYFKGIVFDADTEEKLEARFELINLEQNEVVMEAQSDKITGEFLVCIPTDNDYALNVSKEGYLFYSDNFSLKGVREITDPFIKDVGLNPIKPGEKIILRNIFYATDSYELMDKSIAELDKLTRFLEENPALKIEISGHTDSVGTNEYNLILSEKRAKSVVNYLVSQGIAMERLTSKGYGEEQPVDTNETEEGRANNRRTEIKILSN